MLLHKIPTKQSDLFLYCVFPVFLTPAPTAPSFRKDHKHGSENDGKRGCSPHNGIEHRRYHEREDFISTRGDKNPAGILIYLSSSASLPTWS